MPLIKRGLAGNSKQRDHPGLEMTPGTRVHLPNPNPFPISSEERIRWRDLLLLLSMTLTSVLIHGYRLGQEDGAIYVPAIKKLLDPGLYPVDAAFFLSQTRWMLFTEMVAASVRATRLPLDLAIFLWHLLSIFLVLLALRKLSQLCFAKPLSQWAAVTTVWAARLFPVAGTRLNLMDHHLHPRDLATAAILFALVAMLKRQPRALAWLAFAAVMHPTMALFGAFHLAVQWPGSRALRAGRLPRLATLLLVPAAALRLLWPRFFGGLPFALPGSAPNAAWRALLATRPYLYPLRWHWYEWVGVVVPLVLLGLYAQRARRDGAGLVEHLSRRGILAGLLGVAGSIVITSAPVFEQFIPIEPMRTLHFVYFLCVFLSGGMLGEHFLHANPRRWVSVFLPLCLIFFLADRLDNSASPLVEWPGSLPKNVWVEAFDWARRNTPREALFALDPYYMFRPGEDVHGFRAFAERSMLADWAKDRAVSALEPGIAFQWQQEVHARENWPNFQAEDFRKLRKLYGVTWVVLERGRSLPPPHGESSLLPDGLTCPYQGDRLLICRIE